MSNPSVKRTLLGVAGVAIALGAYFAMRAEPVDEVSIVPEPELDRPGQMECPSSAGPEMVRLPEGFCIDTTEVTRTQYAAWLDASPSPAGQPAACVGNDSFEPTCAWPASDDQGDLPVVCVDWCDARAFCEAAGKRLCGGIGDGGEYAPESYADATVSEWFAACTSGGLHEYTYGDAIERSRCRGGDAEDHTTWGLTAVGSLDGCRSPEDAYAPVHDMSGNAAEWDGACEGDEPDSPCRIRGGSFEHQHHGLRCAMGENLRWPRSRRQQAVGFRCCAD